MGFLSGARRFANEFAEGAQEGFQQRKLEIEGSPGRQERNAMLREAAGETNDPAMLEQLNGAINNTQKFNQLQQLGAAANAAGGVDEAAQQLLAQKVDDLIIDKAARGFGINTQEARGNLGQLLNNEQFAHDLKIDPRINKYVVRGRPGAREQGGQVLNALDKGVPPEQFNTGELGLANGIIADAKSQDRLRRKQDIVFGLHPDGVKDAGLMDDLRLRSDYQAINLEKTNEFERANQILDLVNDGQINVDQLNNADLGKIGVLNDARTQAANQRTQQVADLGRSLWNERNPNDQVTPEEFSRRRSANDAEGRRMAADRFVGNGAFGIVFENKNKPGMLTKQEAPVSGAWTAGVAEGTGLSEINNLNKMQGTPGVPKMGDAVMLNDGTTRFDMEDLRDNYEVYADKFDGNNDRLTDIKVAQQLGGFNLKGFDLDDRHNKNIMLNATTGRPMQVDFGIGSELNNNQSKAIALGRNTVQGFNAAGLDDEAEIFSGLMNEMLAAGKVDDAWDMAKQGFSRLQKIKKPIMAPSVMS